MAISELSQPKRDFLLQCVLEGEVLAAIGKRSGLPALPAARSARVEEVRARLQSHHGLQCRVALKS